MPAPSEPRFALALRPERHFHLDARGDEALPSARISARISEAFERGSAAGLLHLGSVELASELGPTLAFGRELARRFFGALCRVEDLDAARAKLTLPAPEPPELAELAASAPPMVGGEYLSPEVLADAWRALEAEVRRELAEYRGTAAEYLHDKSPLFNVVGRVCFHLAENRANEAAPFAFLATYAAHVTRQGKVQHAPLGRAIEEYAGAGKKPELLRLLEPVKRAAEKSELARALLESGELFHPLAWTPAEALALLEEVPALEASGVVVRVPDWWRARRTARPSVSVTLGDKAPSGVGAQALLQFQAKLTLGEETVSPAEWRALLAGEDGLRLVKGQWVVIDRARMREVLAQWQRVERSGEDGVSFLDGMRLLAGLPAGRALGGDADAMEADEAASWSEVRAGAWLTRTLDELRAPADDADPGALLRGTLRPYQQKGVAWLRLLFRLGLGGCLADDMGLGKTIQVLSLLLLLKKSGEKRPHLLVVPASLLGNWSAERERFAPSLRALVAHPSATPRAELDAVTPAALARVDFVVTTYGALLRFPWLRETEWGLIALDEAQAIKNPGAKQTRAAKALRGHMRLALTGTPVENRLGDLWSLFDFICPGLLGSAKSFSSIAKRIESGRGDGYARLRAVIKPYLLRRLKTDPRVVADLPAKTEVRAYCNLTKRQAALYQRTVEELAVALDAADGMKRRGVVLATLMRLKQICNHPSQLLGDGAFEPGASGKLARLAELAEPIAERQEKLLVFTQFREMTEPLSHFLAGVFGRPGLVLHGGTAVGARRGLVAAFQDEEGPPFFVLSLKAGGTGLNLTAASHVIHFDRWWNPAVEAQATDRAYRIGQKKNVLVHKFVCRGTVEEKIDALLEQKRGLSEELLSETGEAWLTEMKSDELLRLVSLDLHTALEEG